MYDFELFRIGSKVRNKKTGTRYTITGFDRDPHQFGVNQDMKATLEPIGEGRKTTTKVANLEFA